MSKTKVTVTGTQLAQNWNQRMKQSVTKTQNGVNAVTDSPMEKAAGKKDKMLANLTAAVTNGKWEAGLRKVSLADWKAKTVQKIGERMSGGVDAAMNKMTEFGNWQVNRLNTILPEIAGMPDTTLDDSINRAATFMRRMAEQPYKS